MRGPAIRAVGWLTVVALLVVRTARADDEAESRARARTLAAEGDGLFARGRCDRAIAAWRDADAAFHAPTIVLRIARCEALLGRVVEAAAALESIAAEGASQESSEAFRFAREDAARELPIIRARIATIVIGVDGAPGAAVRAEIDGHAVGVASAVSVDPGAHEVRVTSGSSVWSQRVKVSDGEARDVAVRLVPRGTPGSGSGTRTLGFVLGGAGMAIMGVGAGFGAASVALSHDLYGACGPQGSACPPGRQGQIDTLKRDALVSDLALGSGAALFLTGAIVLLTQPLTRSREAVQFDIVGTGVRLRGEF